MSLMPITLDVSQISAVARLFSSCVLRELARKGKSAVFARLAMESTLTDFLSPTEPVRNLFDVALSLLQRKNYRHEYVYKTAITRKVLLGKHSLRTASMLTEFRVGGCKADIVILNGSSTVYEIKSERDKLDRLPAQILAYRQVFANVNIIAGENHLKAVLASIPSDVGVLVLTDRNQISTVREAVDDPGRVVPSVMFESLQLNESRRILESLGIRIPDAPNTQMYQSLGERFAKLDANKAHSGMVQVLKDTRSLRPLMELVEAMPLSLYAAVFSMTLSLRERVRLLGAMETPVQEALNWV